MNIFRCVSNRMCLLYSLLSTEKTVDSPGRKQNCNTSGRRCCWRRRSTLTYIGYDAVKTKQDPDAYSWRSALAGCEFMLKKKHRASSLGTTSGNFASMYVSRFSFMHQFHFCLSCDNSIMTIQKWKVIWTISFLPHNVYQFSHVTILQDKTNI